VRFAREDAFVFSSNCNQLRTNQSTFSAGIFFPNTGTIQATPKDIGADIILDFQLSGVVTDVLSDSLSLAPIPIGPGIHILGVRKTRAALLTRTNQVTRSSMSAQH
jgi:hypothetical protein